MNGRSRFYRRTNSLLGLNHVHCKGHTMIEHRKKTIVSQFLHNCHLVCWVALFATLGLSLSSFIIQPRLAASEIGQGPKVRYCGTIKYRFAESFKRNGKGEGRSVNEKKQTVVGVDWYVCLLLQGYYNGKERFALPRGTEELKHLHVTDSLNVKCRSDFSCSKTFLDVDISASNPRFEKPLMFQMDLNLVDDTYDIRVGAPLSYTMTHKKHWQTFKSCDGPWQRTSDEYVREAVHRVETGPFFTTEDLPLGGKGQVFGRLPPLELPSLPFSSYCNLAYIDVTENFSPAVASWGWDLWRIDESEDCEQVYAECGYKASRKFVEASSGCHEQAGIEGTCFKDRCTTLECLRQSCPAMKGLSLDGQLDFAQCVFTALAIYQTDNSRCVETKRQCVLGLKGSD